MSCRPEECQVRNAMMRAVGPEGDRLYFLLQRAAANMRRVTDSACMRGGGITAAQAGALYAIRLAGRPTQKEVSTALGLGETAITSMVGRLLGAGLVERQVDPDDGRAWRLELAPAGREALDRIDHVRQRLNSRMADALGQDSVAPLATALAALAAMDDGPDGPE
ncbi:MAG: MarR family winged helix-turn-helix transcriptional regulator [Acidimicrobiales bacterium]